MVDMSLVYKDGKWELYKAEQGHRLVIGILLQRSTLLKGFQQI